MVKLTRWVIYGTPSDEFKKANVDFRIEGLRRDAELMVRF